METRGRTEMEGMEEREETVKVASRPWGETLDRGATGATGHPWDLVEQDPEGIPSEFDQRDPIPRSQESTSRGWRGARQGSQGPEGSAATEALVARVATRWGSPIRQETELLAETLGMAAQGARVGMGEAPVGYSSLGAQASPLFNGLTFRISWGEMETSEDQAGQEEPAVKGDTAATIRRSVRAMEATGGSEEVAGMAGPAALAERPRDSFSLSWRRGSRSAGARSAICMVETAPSAAPLVIRAPGAMAALVNSRRTEEREAARLRPTQETEGSAGGPTVS